MTTATKTAQAIATVTLKSNGLTYTLYPVKDYAVWTINGKPTHCTCKARKFNPHKLCKHMQAWLSENSQVVEAPVCCELKTSFSSIEEEFQYKLGAYGKKVAYGWLYEQKHAAHMAALEETAPVVEVMEAAHNAMVQFDMGTDPNAYDTLAATKTTAAEREAKQREAEETAASYMRHFYDEY